MNKFLHVTNALWNRVLLLVVMTVGIVSCRQTYSPMGVIDKMADKNIPGSYSRAEVDTQKMVVSVYEFELLADKSGRSYLSQNGELTETQSADSVAWERGGYLENNAFIALPIRMLEADTTLNFKWSSMTLFDGSLIYIKGSWKNNIGSINNNFVNHTWERSDTTYFFRNDTIPYLTWKQAKGNDAKLTQEQIDEKRQYFAQQWVKDTIAWFNKTHLPSGSKPIPDSIKVGAKSGSKYICVYYIASETTEIRQVPVGIKEVSCSSINFTRDGALHNRGTYNYHYMSQDSAHLVDPTKSNAQDSVYCLEVDMWCISNPKSTSTFEILARGTKTNTSWIMEDGVKRTVKDENVPNFLQSFPMSSFYVGDCVTYGGVEHYLKK